MNKDIKEAIGEIITCFLEYRMFMPTDVFHSPTIDIHQVVDHVYIIEYKGVTLFSGYVDYIKDKYEVRGGCQGDIDKYLPEIHEVIFNAVVDATTRNVIKEEPIEVVVEPDIVEPVETGSRFKNIEVD